MLATALSPESAAPVLVVASYLVRSLRRVLSSFQDLTKSDTLVVMPDVSVPIVRLVLSVRTSGSCAFLTVIETPVIASANVFVAEVNSLPSKRILASWAVALVVKLSVGVSGSKASPLKPLEPLSRTVFVAPLSLLVIKSCLPAEPLMIEAETPA